MKALTTLIISAGLFIAIILLGLALSRPVLASGDHHNDTQNTYNHYSFSKSDNRAGVVAALVGVGLGVLACKLWFCEKDKPEPMPNPGPAVKNDITPSNLSDKRTFVIEAH